MKSGNFTYFFFIPFFGLFLLSQFLPVTTFADPPCQRQKDLLENEKIHLQLIEKTIKQAKKLLEEANAEATEKCVLNYKPRDCKRALAEIRSISENLEKLETSREETVVRIRKFRDALNECLRREGPALQKTGVPVANGPFEVHVISNPVKNDLKMTIASDKQQTIQVQITNSLGLNVLVKQEQLIVGINQKSYSMSSFARGLYLVRLLTNQGNSTTIKILKQ